MPKSLLLLPSKRRTAIENERMDSPQRTLTHRFLCLPFRHQFTVAKVMGVLTSAEVMMMKIDPDWIIKALFRRAYERGLLAQLWDETEKRHADPAAFNPFAGEAPSSS